MKKAFLVFTFLLFCLSGYAIVEETGSLKGFIWGEETNASYDNWVTHITEGIARNGYNRYAPYDKQTTGFGLFRVANGDELEAWGNAVDNFLLGNYRDAQTYLSNAAIPYSIVMFNDTDTNKTFYLMRENINPNYHDDNGTPDYAGDDEHGAFDYGWGLYIHNPNATLPIVITTPHPNDDFFTVQLSQACFSAWDAAFLCITGAGREVLWTQSGYYTNSKSLSDPTRRSTHPFNVSYEKFCDYTRTHFGQRELSVQLHSYDWGNSHAGYAACQVSAGNSRYSPDLPIRDFSSKHLDIVHALGEIVLESNAVGIHEPVMLNDYMTFNSRKYDFSYYREDGTTFAVNTHLDLPGYSESTHEEYSSGDINDYDNFEPFFHVEFDEFPETYPQDNSTYSWFWGMNPATGEYDIKQTQDNCLAYYKPFIDGMAAILPPMFNMDDNEVPVAVDSIWVQHESIDEIGVAWQGGDAYDMFSYEVLYSNEPIDNDNYDIWNVEDDNRLACLANRNADVGGLTLGQMYYFKVRLSDKNGNYSVLSNEVTGMAGIASIASFEAFGRDSLVEIQFRAIEQADNCLGFDIYRKEANEADYSRIASWEQDAELGGSTANYVWYSYDDDTAINGMFYSYIIKAVDVDMNSFKVGYAATATPDKIFELIFEHTTTGANDTLWFGSNVQADDFYDADYDDLRYNSASGNYFFAEFYEDYWHQNYDNLEKQIHEDFDETKEYKKWTPRFRTNMTNQVVRLHVGNQNRDAQRLYLISGGNVFDLQTGYYDFTAWSTDWIYFDLYWGNLLPNIQIGSMANKIFHPEENVNFSWNSNLTQLIQHFDVMLADGDEMISVAENLPNTATSSAWEIPMLDKEDLHFVVKAVLVQGDTLTITSDYAFGIKSPSYQLRSDIGWQLVSTPVEDSPNTIIPQDIYGVDSHLYGMGFFGLEEKFNMEYLKGYWLDGSQENDYLIDEIDVSQGAESIETNIGWNIIANPHIVDYDLSELSFFINGVHYSYAEAVSFRLIEPLIFNYDGYFSADSNVIKAGSACYLYAYEASMSIRFIPFVEPKLESTYEYDWCVRLMATGVTENSDICQVGVSTYADSLHNPLYDLKKPTPYAPAERMQISIMHIGSSFDSPTPHYQVIDGREEVADYIWDVHVELDSLQVVSFSAQEMNLPDGMLTYLVFADRNIILSGQDEYSFLADSTQLDFGLRVTDLEVGTDNNTSVPRLALSAVNYPNPFNPTTTINFNLPAAGHVDVSIYNIKGQKVINLVDEHRTAGQQNTLWNGVDSRGKSVASGVFFYRIKAAGGHVITNKMLLLK